MIHGDAEIRWMCAPCKSTLQQRRFLDYGPRSITRDIPEPHIINTITKPAPPIAENPIIYKYLEASTIRGNGILVDNKQGWQR